MYAFIKNDGSTRNSKTVVKPWKTVVKLAMRFIFEGFKTSLNFQIGVQNL